MELSLQLIFSICFFNFLNNCTAHSNSPIHHRSKFIDYVKSNGYEGKSYHVETEDGYILRLDRISGSQLSPKAPGKPVVFFQHGIILSSDMFVIWDPKDSLVYLLADAGYDIWLPNVRGNTNGRRHKTLSPEDHKFWNFTIDDLGATDLPTHIDFALKETGQPCITYIGYSMGASMGYVLLSEKPKYNDKISFIVNLAPVVYWNYDAEGFIRPLWATATDAGKVFLNAPNYATEALGHNPIVESLIDHYCAEGTTLCTQLWNKVFISAAKGGLQPQDIRHLSHYFPAGTSLKNLQHYRQMMYTGFFRKFDYGSAERNIEAYGKKTPPNYDVQRTKSKIALIWTHNDVFANKLNVDLLAKQLPNVVTVEPVSTTHFHHGDFIYRRNAKALIYDRIIDLINDHHECPMQKIYGKKIPPCYNLLKTTRKIALIWTHNDIFANELNVKLLAKHLPIVVTIEPVPTKQFLHADFIFHRNGKSLIWDRIIELINNHHECLINNNFDDYELVRKKRRSNIIFKKLSVDNLN